MSGTGDGGETSATGGTTPASLDPASSASADATVEGELSRDAQNQILQEKSCSAPPSPSKVLGAGKNSTPSFSLPRSAARTPREQDTASDVDGTPGTKVPGVAATPETRSEHTLSEFAAGIQEDAAADAQREAASTGMEHAMTGLLDPSHKKVQTPKLPRDFATKCPSSDADPLDGGVMDDPVIWSSGYVDRLHGGVMDDPVTLSSGYFTESSDYQVKNDSMLDKLMIMRSAAEIDSTEELLHDIKSLKDEYLYKLMELDREYTVPTEGDKTEESSNRERTKTSIRKMLKFLQVEKCNVHKGLKKKLPKYTALIQHLMSVEKIESHELLQTMSWKEQQQQQAQTADASPSFPINSPEGQVQREGAETLVAKNPSDRLLCAIRSSSSGALGSSVRSMLSVLRERDSVPLGAFLDLTSSQQLGGSSNMNKLKCVFDHSLPTQSPLFGSMDDFGMPFEGDSSDSESSGVKSQKMQNTNNNGLVEEIEAINRTLIDTEITIARDSGNDGITSSCDTGTTIKLSYTAVALSGDLKNLFESSEECVVMPAKLCVPPDYPRSSPMLITDNGDDQLRKTSSSISVSVHAAFPLALENLPEPRSIKDIARAWDTYVRRAVTEFARQYGGGTWSSAFGRWERCGGS